MQKPKVDPTPKGADPVNLVKTNDDLRQLLLEREHELGELKATIVRQQERIMNLEFQLRNLLR